MIVIEILPFRQVASYSPVTDSTFLWVGRKLKEMTQQTKENDKRLLVEYIENNENLKNE